MNYLTNSGCGSLIGIVLVLALLWIAIYVFVPESVIEDVKDGRIALPSGRVIDFRKEPKEKPAPTGPWGEGIDVPATDPFQEGLDVPADVQDALDALDALDAPKTKVIRIRTDSDVFNPLYMHLYVGKRVIFTGKLEMPDFGGGLLRLGAKEVYVSFMLDEVYENGLRPPRRWIHTTLPVTSPEMHRKYKRWATTDFTTGLDFNVYGVITKVSEYNPPDDNDTVIYMRVTNWWVVNTNPLLEGLDEIGKPPLIFEEVSFY